MASGVYIGSYKYGYDCNFNCYRERYHHIGIKVGYSKDIYKRHSQLGCGINMHKFIHFTSDDDCFENWVLGESVLRKTLIEVIKQYNFDCEFLGHDHIDVIPKKEWYLGFSEKKRLEWLYKTLPEISAVAICKTIDILNKTFGINCQLSETM